MKREDLKVGDIFLYGDDLLKLTSTYKEIFNTRYCCDKLSQYRYTRFKEEKVIGKTSYSLDGSCGKIELVKSKSINWKERMNNGI